MDTGERINKREGERGTIKTADAEIENALQRTKTQQVTLKTRVGEMTSRRDWGHKHDGKTSRRATLRSKEEVSNQEAEQAQPGHDLDGHA